MSLFYRHKNVRRRRRYNLSCVSGHIRDSWKNQDTYSSLPDWTRGSSRCSTHGSSWRGAFKNGEAFFLCVTLRAYLIGIGASICNSRESWCLPYVGFLVLLFIKLNMSVYCVVNNSDNIEHLTSHIANSSADIFNQTDIYCLLSGLLAL